MSLQGGSSSPDSEPPQPGDIKSDLPIGRYFLYRLVEDQKDVGYKKLLSSNIISDAQKILLEYLDLPQRQDGQVQDTAKGNNYRAQSLTWCYRISGVQLNKTTI